MPFLYVPVTFIESDNDDDDGDLKAILRNKEPKEDRTGFVYVNVSTICSFNENEDGCVEARMVNGEMAVIEMSLKDFEEMLLKIDYIVDINKFITEN